MTRQENARVLSTLPAHILWEGRVHLDDEADNKAPARVHGNLDTKSSLRSVELYFCSTNNGNYVGSERLKTQMRQDTRASRNFANVPPYKIASAEKLDDRRTLVLRVIIATPQET